MTTGHIFIASSLDGFVARRNHDLDWLMKQDSDGEDHGFQSFMSRMDSLVMGAGTFRKVVDMGEWPYPIPVIVMSSSLSQSDIPEQLRDRVRPSRLDPKGVMRELAQSGCKQAYIDGGKLVQSFIRERLITDITLTIIPILLGDGLRLFGETGGDIDLRHVWSKSFPSGLVTHHYRFPADQEGA